MAHLPQTNFVLRHSAGRMPCKPKSGTFSLREKSGSSPRAPADLSRRESRYLTRLRGKYFFLLALLWIKKLDSKNFQLQRTAAKFSANIIWLLFYLFVGSP